MNNTRLKKNQECPPLMSDGRHYTDYRPSEDVNDYRKYKVVDSNQYRLYLQRNGAKLILENRKQSIQRNKCCPVEKQPKSITPFKSTLCGCTSQKRCTSGRGCQFKLHW